MNEQSETIDNYPILSSFLTTIHEHAHPPSQPSLSPRQTSPPPTKQVDQWFQVESKALQAKRQREIAKQNRIKKLEEEFEEQRMKKQKELEEKLSNIEKNKNKNIMNIQEKFHKISVRHHKVYSKIQDDNLKQLEMHYDSRKAYEIETARPSTRLINTSQHSHSDNRNKSIRDSKSKTLQQEQVTSRISEITLRLQKAKTISRQKNEETINKARNHNVFDLYQAQTKAKDQYDDYLKMYANRLVSKMESADLTKDKIGKKLEKKNEQRHKAYSQKLKRIQTNLIQRQEQQEQKFEELSKKLQRNSATAKGEKQHRETLYHKRFLDNLQQIEREKICRADQIIQKHQQISLKNRLFKEKKQTLYRHLKVQAL